MQEVQAFIICSSELFKVHSRINNSVKLPDTSLSFPLFSPRFRLCCRIGWDCQFICFPSFLTASESIAMLKYPVG